jgi:lipoprotein-releasing system permease protein
MNISNFLAGKIKNTKNQTFSSLVIKVGVVSIAIAVSVLTLSFFILFGFKNTIKEKLFSITSHIQISKFTVNRSFEEASMPNNFDFYNKSLKIPQIKSINRVAYKSIIIKSEEEISGVVFKGVDNAYNWESFEINLVEGRKLNFNKEKSDEIIVSKKIMRELNLKLNDDLLIYFIQNPPRARKLKIVGIYETNVEELDQIYVLGDLNLIRKINNWENEEFGHYEVFIKDIGQLNEVKNQLLNVFSQDYQVLKVTELLPQFFDWFNLLDRNIILVIVLILVVAAFNMISVLLIMIMERTPMIGLLKSIGTQNKLIQNIFIKNGGNIILKGLIWGNVIGLGLSFVQDKFKFVKLDPVNYYMSAVPIEWAWDWLIYINISVFVIIWVILLIPSYVIYKINPVEALKYKD